MESRRVTCNMGGLVAGRGTCIHNVPARLRLKGMGRQTTGLALQNSTLLLSSPNASSFHKPSSMQCTSCSAILITPHTCSCIHHMHTLLLPHLHYASQTAEQDMCL